jgi:hypothetical protein
VPEQYIRLDPPLSRSSPALDDCSPTNMRNMQLDLQDYMALPSTTNSLDFIARSLLASEQL